MISILSLISISAFSQYQLQGKVINKKGEAVSSTVHVVELDQQISTDENGNFTIDFTEKGGYSFIIYDENMLKSDFYVTIENDLQKLSFELATDEILNEIVINIHKNCQVDTGVIAKESYSEDFFKKTTVANVLESMELINGVQPKINCGVCNTGDIHINGLEGANTLVLIDGLPMVSGLSTVYGLSGIPLSMIEKIEVIKGPAPSIYGSEAIGGMINIITKNPLFAPKYTVNSYISSWGEWQTDLGFSNKIGKKVNYLAGIHLFNYGGLHDKNKDNFTDLTN